MPAQPLLAPIPGRPRRMTFLGTPPPARLGTCLAAFVCLTSLMTFALPARAATPHSGTLSLANPSLAWVDSVFGATLSESQCTEGVSCDTFQLTLAPGDYTGQQVNVTISWLIPANDYDFFIHQGTLGGPVLFSATGGAPETFEHGVISIHPGVVTQPLVYVVHVVASNVAPGDPCHSLAALGPEPVVPNVSHVAGSLPFSRTVSLIARGTVRDEEPSIRVDSRGTCYVGSIRGVPAGVDMWRFDLNPASPTFDPEMKHASYLGQPDVFQQAGAEDSTAGGADGGGDIDFATSYPTSPDSTPVITMVSLAVANISSGVSFDRGATWQHEAASAFVASDDRQWIDTDGPNTVYLFYRAPVPSSGLFVQRSTDHGVSYGTPALVTTGLSSTPGYIAVDHNNGFVYVAHTNSTALFVSRSTDQGATWTTVTVDNSTSHAHLFDAVKVGKDGTVYTVWSSEDHIHLAYSTDHGVTWVGPLQVDDGVSTATNVFPWIDAGSAGRIAVVWYGSTSANVNSAHWTVMFSQCLNVLSGNPTFAQQVISDHVIHGSNISEGGLTGAANRNLGDYFQVAYDPQGAAVVAFADDHNDYDGATYAVRQLGGPGLLASANGGTGQVQTVSLSPWPVFDPTAPQVTDPLHDALAGPLQPIVTDNPFDITSITYFCDNNGPNAPYLGARMALSGLTTLPPNGSWRMSFTANAPFATGYLPDGISDLGDQFFLQAADSAGLPSFNYGIGFRDSMPNPPAPVGSPFVMAYSWRGFADSGRVDTVGRTLTVKVALSKINALLAQAGHAPIGVGSWLAGLRGVSGVSGANEAHDNTRGGTQNYQMVCDGITAVAPPPRVFSMNAAPNPSRGASLIRYSLPRAGQVTLAIYDVTGRRVRTLAAGTMQDGSYIARWDGRDASGHESGSGVYFARLRLGAEERLAKLMVIR